MVALDEVFELLEDQRRRYALYCLYEKDGPVAVSELVKKNREMGRRPVGDRWEY
ncbi:DUF7344 domain-containing protein [Natronosalvus caseinilyticus]|uniref:DUF7344 domain-containing protein n=1 Tax=Natronosalvus caseinilyticus TaxID=2953747 RepID=UPI003CCE0B9B